MSTGLEEFLASSQESTKKALHAFNGLARRIAVGELPTAKEIGSICAKADKSPADLTAAIVAAKGLLQDAADVEAARVNAVKATETVQRIQEERPKFTAEVERILRLIVELELARKRNVGEAFTVKYQHDELVTKARAALRRLAAADAESYGIDGGELPGPVGQPGFMAQRTEWDSLVAGSLIRWPKAKPFESPVAETPVEEPKPDAVSPPPAADDDDGPRLDPFGM